MGLASNGRTDAERLSGTRESGQKRDRYLFYLSHHHTGSGSFVGNREVVVGGEW